MTSRERNHVLVTLGRAIAHHRRIAGLTQLELADALDVSRHVIANWETGRNDPAVARLPALARAVGCPLAELLRDLEPGR